MNDRSMKGKCVRCKKEQAAGCVDCIHREEKMAYARGSADIAKKIFEELDKLTEWYKGKGTVHDVKISRYGDSELYDNIRKLKQKYLGEVENDG